MIATLPIRPEPNQRFSVVLNNQHCTFELFQRYDHLYMNMYVGEEPIITGIVCLNRQDLIQIATTSFVGFLWFVDLLGDTDPQWEGLGNRYQMVFATPEELTEVAVSS